MVVKTCTKCKVEKSLDCFSKHPNGMHGRQPRCKDCQKEYSKVYYKENKEKWIMTEAKERAEDPEAFKQKCREAQARYRANPANTIKLRYLKKRYGLTVEQYLAMESAQNRACAICGGPPNGRYDRLHVDHDHKTGKVRALLCYSCNILLGTARDEVRILEAAAAYLRSHLL